jgi:hypothetical protein
MSTFDWRWQCTTGLKFPWMSKSKEITMHNGAVDYPACSIANLPDPWFELIVVLIVSLCVDDCKEMKEKGLATMKTTISEKNPTSEYFTAQDLDGDCDPDDTAKKDDTAPLTFSKAELALRHAIDDAAELMLNTLKQEQDEFFCQ